jgi:tetratricopeptide (TPR) repeat protein
MKYLLIILAICATSVAETPKNAGLIYWQAFATLPPIDDKLEQELRDWRTLDITNVAANLHEVEMSMAFLHRAAELTGCDWGIDWSDGGGTLLPHLSKARALARIACLRGRIYMANGRVRDAIDDYCAAMALARHTGDAAVLGKLVHVSIESDAIDGLSDHLARLSRDELNYLELRLDLLPPIPSLAAALQLEQGWAAREISEGEAVDMELALSWAARFNGVLDQMTENELAQAVDLFGRVNEAHFLTLRDFVELPETREETHALMKKLLQLQAVRSGSSIVHLDGTIGLDPDAPGKGDGSSDVSVQCKALMQEGIDLAGLPLAEMLAKAPDLDAAVAEAKPLVRDMLANFGSVMRRHAGCEVRIQMLRAAIALLRDEPAALTDFPDPVSGEAFTVTRDIDTLSLASSLNDGRGAVTLTAQSHGSVVPPLPAPQHMKKIYADLQLLRAGHYDNPQRDPKARAAFDKFYGDMEKRVDTVLTHLDQNEDDKRDAMLELLMEGAFDFIDTWAAIIDDAIDGDHSAFVAAAIIQRTPNIEVSLIHHTLQDRREDLTEIIGEAAADELIYMVGERRRQAK